MPSNHFNIVKKELPKLTDVTFSELSCRKKQKTKKTKGIICGKAYRYKFFGEGEVIQRTETERLYGLI